MAYPPRSLCVALLVSWALPARADAPADQAAPEIRARKLFDRGVELIGERKWNDAIIELEAARAIYPTAPIHFNLGLAYRGAGRATEAIAAFERYRRAVEGNPDPQRQAEVARYLATLRASLAQLRLDVTPADANVQVDGATAPSGMLELDPGQHEVSAGAGGYVAVTRTVKLAPGSTTTLSLHLSRSGQARLRVSSSQGEVRIDGVAHGHGPVEVELDPGRHVVEVQAKGYQGERREVTLGLDERRELSLTLKPERKVGRWVALGVGLAVAIGGAVALGVVLGVKDEPPLAPQLGVVYTGLKVTSW
jgi:PEGA domain